MLRLLKAGPAFSGHSAAQNAGPGHFKTPLRPLSAVDEAIDEPQAAAQDKEKPHD